MHVEKNVCESIIGTLLNMDKTKDSLKARLEATKLRGGKPPEVTQGKPHPVSYVCTKKRQKDYVILCMACIFSNGLCCQHAKDCFKDRKQI
jgi:hypothetical protein